MKDDSSISSSSRTKRRRTGTSTNSTSNSSSKSDSLVIDIWKLEEEQAAGRDVEKEYQLARQACGNIRRLLKEIMELKLNKGASAEKNEKRIQFLMLVLTLKKFNRLEKIHNKRARDLTNEVKAKVDAHHLKLLNLLYETTHLTKEVNKCLEFKSRDEDIKLIPLEEFYKEAPKDISKAETTKNDNHAQTLARLDYELMQRKKLAETYKESEGAKERVSQEIKCKEEYLDSLAPSLHTILQATIPVQERLGMKQQVKSRQNGMANLLPTPLFILYVKMNAYSEAWDDAISMTVEGDYEEAKAVKQPAEEKYEESGESDQEEFQTNNRYRRSTTDRLGEKRRKILTKHPLNVSAVFSFSGCTLKLHFYYLVTLNIVTVTSELHTEVSLGSPTINVLTTNALLEYLFDGDSGKDTPNEANHYQLQRWGMDDFKSYISDLGRPFVWAQRLAGLEFIRVCSVVESPSKSRKPDANLSGSHMEEAVSAIKKRLAARLNLQKQICNLEQGVVTPTSAEYQKVSTRLISFLSIPWDDYKVLPLTKELISSGIVNSSYFSFKVTFERGTARLIAWVAVSPHYPVVTPVFTLQVEWREIRTGLNDLAIQDLEKEVNIYWNELVDKHRDQLFINQIYRLMICFDLYLETEDTNESEGKMKEFPREKNLVYMKSGRDRAKPYKYAKNLGLFLPR
ncbi:THO complex subunit 5 [Chamberlinius hualienensis]